MSPAHVDAVQSESGARPRPADCVPGVALASLGLERVVAEGGPDVRPVRRASCSDTNTDTFERRGCPGGTDLAGKSTRSLGIPRPGSAAGSCELAVRKIISVSVSGGARPEQPRGLEPVEHGICTSRMMTANSSSTTRESARAREVARRSLSSSRTGGRAEEVVGVVVDEQDAQAPPPGSSKAKGVGPCNSEARRRDHPGSVRYVTPRASAVLTFVHGPRAWWGPIAVGALGPVRRAARGPRVPRRAWACRAEARSGTTERTSRNPKDGAPAGACR